MHTATVVHFSFVRGAYIFTCTSAKCTSLDRSTGEGPGAEAAHAGQVNCCHCCVSGLPTADSLSAELILSNQNTKQGLGFCVGHRVVDLKTLGNIVTAIVGVATTAVPILFSLRPSTASDGIGLESCGLSAAEQEAVRAMVGSWANSSMCSYNQTLDDILAGV